MHDEIVITNQINAYEREQVARLYLDAFPKKFMSLWLFSLDDEHGVPALAASLNAQEGVYALRNGTVLGFVGLESGKRYYAHLTYKALRKGFGVFGAAWRRGAYFLYRLFHGGMRSDVLHIDPIVVSSEARGLGIGSRLIETVLDYAPRINKKKVILEVVDTNPDAQRLYERKGFSPVYTQDLGVLASGAGFRRVVHMECPVKTA